MVIDGFFKLKSRFTLMKERKKKIRQITIQRQLANSQKYTCSLNERHALSDTSGGALELVMIQM